MTDLRPLKTCKNPGCGNRTYERYCYDCKTSKDTPDKERYRRYDSKERDPDSRAFYDSRFWKLLREEQIKRFPACQWPMPSGFPCLSADRLNVDHITPRKAGGKDTGKNLQTLCHNHHTEKTNTEANRFFGRTSITVICGPPGSGKTTYAMRHMTPGCIMWDQDKIQEALTGSPLHYAVPAVLDTCLAIREFLFSYIQNDPSVRSVYWIESAPTHARRATLRDTLKATVIVLETPSEVCLQRIANDVNRDHTYDYSNLVADWWRKYQPSSLDVVIRSDCGLNVEPQAASDSNASEGKRTASDETIGQQGTGGE